MIQFIIIDIYMKNIDEKEKKLTDALQKLREINVKDNNEISELAALRDQKNQLEIEKSHMAKSLLNLEQENLKLKSQVDEIKKDYEISKRKESKLDEKIDELNQETDSLLYEIDKWQM